MSDVDHQIFQWLSGFAYQPYQLYAVVILIMYASSFGLPFPEEITLISVGLIAFAASRPDLYPPPYPDAPSVNIYVAAAVCTFAVFSSDLLVFWLGKMFARPLSRHKTLGKWVDPEQSPKLDAIRKKWGVWACGVFRFTPGLRFPGHLSCGALGVPTWKFTAIDGAAVLISVPTQVYFVGKYGDVMLGYIKQFKVYLFSALAIALLGYIAYRIAKYLNSAHQGRLSLARAAGKKHSGDEGRKAS